MFTFIQGIVVPGTQGASGRRHWREVGGSIRAQKKFFERAGVDMGGIFPGTVNVSIAPNEFRIRRPDHEIRDAKWHPDHAPEDFSLVRCRLIVGPESFEGYIYFPHPEKKIGRFPGYSVLEILTSFVPGIDYGAEVLLGYDPGAVTILPRSTGAPDPRK